LKRCDESCAAQPLRAPQPHEGGDYGDNPNRAVSFVEELLDRCLALADTPRAYPLVPRYEHFGIRRCVHGNYQIFYRLQPEQIEVIHVLQGARSGQGVDGPPAPPMMPPSAPLSRNALLRLSAEDQRRFAEALFNPPVPNNALKHAKRLHLENVEVR
jgi:toxin ParE1/3/4